MAVTEHGNMFSSVVFHDKARQAGHQADPRVRSVRRDRAAASPRAAPSARPTTTSCCWRRRAKGYQNLIKLVSAGYTEGFHYRPRIDRELLARHSAGLIGLSSCLKGEIPARLLAEQERQAIEAAAFYRDTLGAGQLLPRDAVPGHRGTEGGQRGAPAGGQGRSTCRSCARTTCTTCTGRTSRPTTSCSASARRRRSTTRSACATTATSST